MSRFSWLRPRQPVVSWAIRSGFAGLALVAGLAYAREMTPAASPVPLSELPAEARQTYRLIRSGGPFATSHDGSVFGNREHLLAARRRGFYREYTVPTPGARDRGARRIICGGDEPRAPDVCFYTADHYASFYRIAR